MIDSTDTCVGLTCCDPNPFGYMIPDGPTLVLGDVCSSCQGANFSQTITAYRIGPTLLWTLTSGSLPTGLTSNFGSNSNGFITITGTPSGSGPYTFTVTATDNFGNSVSGTFTIRIINITNASLPPVTLNIPYSAQLTAAGGIGPYYWFVLSGMLATGLNLNSSTGVISGTPTANGTDPVTFGVIDTGCQPT